MTGQFRHIEKIIDENYSSNEYPALYSQSRQWGENKPLSGLTILDSSPVFRNTLAKYLPLMAAGAHLSVGVSDAMPYDPEILSELRKIGMHITTPGVQTEEFDLVLDCAGAFSATSARLGYVELTRSGLERYTGHTKPVFVADSGRIKRIETLLGTGESLFRALRSLDHKEFCDKKMIVMGSGKVGSGIILYGHTLGTKIYSVTDPASVSPATREKCTAIIDFRDKSAVISCIRDADFIVTATGTRDAVGDKELAQAISDSGALLANMGVEDEFGPEIAPERVLNRKKPLNFILPEPTHMKYIEATMALHNAGALYIVRHPGLHGIIDPPADMEAQLLETTRSRGLIGEELSLI